ncbi:hypothetical protein CBL_20273 [Carabus blaptoides fortunei]
MKYQIHVSEYQRVEEELTPQLLPAPQLQPTPKQGPAPDQPPDEPPMTAPIQTLVTLVKSTPPKPKYIESSDSGEEHNYSFSSDNLELCKKNAVIRPPTPFVAKGYKNTPRVTRINSVDKSKKKIDEPAWNQGILHGIRPFAWTPDLATGVGPGRQEDLAEFGRRRDAKLSSPPCSTANILSLVCKGVQGAVCGVRRTQQRLYPLHISRTRK